MRLLNKNNEQHLNWDYEKLEEAFPNKQLNLDKKQIYSVEELILKFKDEFDQSEKQKQEMLENIKNALKGKSPELDDHETSKAMNKIVGEENESVDEGENTETSGLTKEEMDSKESQSELKQTDIDDMVKNAINEIIESSKIRGTEPSEQEKRLFEIITRKDTAFDFIKVKNIIKNALGVTPVRTYKKIHRHKSFFTGVPLKGKIFKKPKRLIFAIDTSGSVSDKELTAMMSILFNYLRKHSDVTIDVIAWSSSLDNHYKNVQNEKDILSMKMGSTGGTCIDFLWKHLEKEFPEEKLSVVVITDGYISKEKYNEEIINDLYFGLTANTEQSVRDMYPNSEIVKVRIEY